MSGAKSLGAWFYLLCLSRIAHGLIFSAYAAVMPLSSAAWGLSAAQAGAIQSAWHLGYLVSLFGVGFLADAIGAKLTYLRTSIAAGASAVAFAAFSDGFLSAFLLYGLAGLCSGGTYTPGLKLIFERVPAHARGLAMGLFLGAASAGYAAALFVSSAIAPAGLWREVLLVSAGAACAGSLIAHAALKAVPNVTHPASGPVRLLPDLRAVTANKAAMACILAYTFHCWELLGMWAWLPTFMSALSATGGAGVLLGKGILLVAVSHLVAGVGSVFGGRLSDSIGRPQVMMIMTCASLACSFTLGWMINAPFWLVAAVAIAYNLFAISDSAVYSTALAEVVAPPRLGAAYSLRSVLGFGAGAVSPWVFGLVLDFGRAGELSETTVWALAWTSLGIGGLLGPFMIRSFARHARDGCSMHSRPARTAHADPNHPAKETA